MIHPQLNADCHILGFVNDHAILLHKNAIIPWFIVLPPTDKTELLDLDENALTALFRVSKRVTTYLTENRSCTKTNVASLGNQVPQLHVHVVGRKENDNAWPNPIWGNLTEERSYSSEEIEHIKMELSINA